METKFTSHKQYFGLFFLEIQRRPIQTKLYYKFFYSVLKEKNISQSSCKKVFPKCMLLIQLASSNVFLFHVIIGRNYFLYKFIINQKHITTAMLLLSLKQAFWKKSLFYVCYLHNNIRMLLIPKVQTKASTS